MTDFGQKMKTKEQDQKNYGICYVKPSELDGPDVKVRCDSWNMNSVNALWYHAPHDVL